MTILSLFPHRSRSQAAAAVAALVLLALTIGTARAGQSDPLFGYLLSASGRSWALGGELGLIRPPQLMPPIVGDDGRRWGFNLSGIYSDYYREGGFEGGDASFMRGFNGGAFMRGRGATMWDAEARTGERSWRINIFEEQHDPVLNASCANWVTSLESKVALRPFMLSAGLGTGPENPYEPVFAAGAEFAPYGAFGAMWTRRYLCPDLDFYWREEHGRVVLDGLREELTGWMRSPRLGRLHAELLLQRHKWLSVSKESVEATVEPSGDEVTYHGFFAMSLGRWRGLMGVRGRDTDLAAYGMKGDYDYAKITACRLLTSGIFASVEYRPSGRCTRLLGELERLEWDGHGRGHLEFWPFTEGFLDLLGLRRYFIANTEGHIWRLHLGGEGPIAKRWWYTAGLNLLDVRPSADIRHWRPSFLVFGVEDEQTHRLSIRHVLAGVVSLSMRYRMSRWEMEYSLSQAVPLRVRRHTQENMGDPPDDPLPAGESGGYGGGFHRLSLSWYF